MVKELEVLCDYVDGYLSAVLDEESSNIQLGKVQFIGAFRDSLLKVPSEMIEADLIKTLNRNLLKASALPADFTINKKRGFDEALLNMQNKLKELFKLDDLNTGTVQHFLEDIPLIVMPERVNFPDPSILIASEDPAAELKACGERIKASLKAQTKILRNHLESNGKLIVISDNGYTNLDDIGAGSGVLEGLLDASVESAKQLDKMTEKAIALIAAHQANKGGRDSDDDDEN